MKRSQRIGILSLVMVVGLVASAWTASASTTPTRVKGAGKVTLAPKNVVGFNFDLSQDTNGNVSGHVKIVCNRFGPFTATKITAYSVVGNTATFTAAGFIPFKGVGPLPFIANVTASENPNTFSAYVYNAKDFNNWFCQPSGPVVKGKMLIPDPHLKHG